MQRTTVLCVVVLMAVSAVPLPAAAQSEQVTLTVTVVDGQGQPLSGAEFNASWDGGNVVETTRANGQALIDAPRGADVALDVESSNYIRNEPYVVESAENEQVEVEVALKGSATVTVFDQSGDRVNNAVVRLWQDGRPIVNSRADENGELQTPTIEQGEYRLVVFREGYYRNRTTLEVDGQVSQTMTIESGSATVTFDVSDDHFNPARSVQGASIEVAGIGTVQTLQNGEATIQVPVNDVYDVTISKANYSEVTRPVDVEEGPKTVDITVNREPAISISPSNDRVVTGESVEVRITNEYDTPVSNASVSLDGEQVGQTNAEGRLSFVVESQGEHTIRATHQGNSAEYTIEGVTAATTRAQQNDTTTEGDDGGSSTFGPGFGPVAAVLALLSLALLARRRD